MPRLTIRAAALVAAGAMLTATGSAQSSDRKIVKMQTLNVRDILYVLTGGGGNTLALMRDDGVVLIDTKMPGWGKSILDTVQAVTDRPITAIINTHAHPDHVGGNVDFTGVPTIVAHERTKAAMQKMSVFSGAGAKSLPNTLVTDRYSMLEGQDRIDVYYFGRGHTDGDAWVVFPSLRTLHAGDIFSGKNLPFLDANNGASGVAIGDTLQKAHDGIKNVDTIISGHSVQMTRADLAEYAAFNREFLNDVRAAIKAGKTVADVASTWKMPAKYAGYTAPMPERLRDNVQVVYDELKAGSR